MSENQSIESETPRPGDWTDERAKELKSLQTLLNEVKAINHGSGAIERIQWCETVAESLTRIELSEPRESFFQFLVTLACKDRQRAKLPNDRTERPGQ